MGVPGSRVLPALAVALATIATSPAYAQASPPAPASDREPAWYGWQTLAVDAVGLGAGLSAIPITASLPIDSAHRPGDAALISTGLYTVGSVGAPAVHWAHGRVGVGFADMGVRVVGPPTVGLLGMLVWCNARSFHECAQDGMIGGVLAGSVLAAALDATVFAYDEPSREPAAVQDEWYGWQTLVADAATLGFGVSIGVRAASQNTSGVNPVELSGIGWWASSFVAPPIVHMAHGRILVGLADFGARLFVPPMLAVAGLLGYCSTTGGQSDCVLDGAAMGIGVGMLGMSLFDGIVLAHDRTPRASTSAPPPSGWVPVLQPVRGGALVGAGGTF